MANDDFDLLCAGAKQALARGDAAAARTLYERALQLQADSPSVLHGLATACYLQRDWLAAAQHFEAVIRLQPDKASAYVNLGAAYKQLDLLEEAVAAINQGIKLDPKRAEAFHNLAAIHRRAGKLDLAIAAYLEALRLDPRMFDAHFYLGTIYQERLDMKMAARHFRAALELKPDWEKAATALEHVETMLNAVVKGPAPLAAVPPPAAPPEIDPERPVDPETQGNELRTAHQAAIELQERSQAFLNVLKSDIEPVLQGLSRRLLDRRGTSADLDDCLKEIETAFERMRAAEETLRDGHSRLEKAGEKLLATPPATRSA